jgi:hypothetical protein
MYANLRKKGVTGQLQSRGKQKCNAEKSRKQSGSTGWERKTEITTPRSPRQPWGQPTGNPKCKRNPQFFKALNPVQRFSVTMTPPAWKVNSESMNVNIVSPMFWNTVARCHLEGSLLFEIELLCFLKTRNSHKSYRVLWEMAARGIGVGGVLGHGSQLRLQRAR